jgi:small-conductance mechanosensitive channel
MITLTKNYQKQKIQAILKTLLTQKPSSNELTNKNKKTTFNISKFLSYFLVFLITFIALIIVLDTFKSPLSSIIPGLEIFLYNFFETLKDLYLFIKNLLS